MKKSLYLIGLALSLALPAGASLYSFGTLDNQPALGPIPDNNTIGLTENYTVSGEGSSLSGLTLTFALQGGASSDVSGYLRLGNTGSSPAYNLTSLIQGTPEAPGGTTYTIDFTSTSFASTFNSLDPNNTWTLFFADTVAGDTTTLNGWSLNVTAVPEPVNLALAVFGGVLAVLALVRRQIQGRRLKV